MPSAYIRVSSRQSRLMTVAWIAISMAFLAHKASERRIIPAALPLIGSKILSAGHMSSYRSIPVFSGRQSAAYPANTNPYCLMFHSSNSSCGLSLWWPRYHSHCPLPKFHRSQLTAHGVMASSAQESLQASGRKHISYTGETCSSLSHRHRPEAQLSIVRGKLCDC